MSICLFLLCYVQKKCVLKEIYGHFKENRIMMDYDNLMQDIIIILKSLWVKELKKKGITSRYICLRKIISTFTLLNFFSQVCFWYTLTIPDQAIFLDTQFCASTVSSIEALHHTWPFSSNTFFLTTTRSVCLQCLHLNTKFFHLFFYIIQSCFNKFPFWIGVTLQSHY